MRPQVSYTPRVMPAALASPHIDRAYYKCWAGLRSHFRRDADPGAKPAAAANGGMQHAAGGAPDAARAASSSARDVATDAQER